MISPKWEEISDATKKKTAAQTAYFNLLYSDVVNRRDAKEQPNNDCIWLQIYVAGDDVLINRDKRATVGSDNWLQEKSGTTIFHLLHQLESNVCMVCTGVYGHKSQFSTNKFI